jgi:ribonucleoside-triphosphate reductase (thioredoxin)
MNKSELSRKILSDITVYSKYAKFIPELKRRETWEEITMRNMEMHIRKFPKLEKEIKKAYEFVYDKKVVPSMRSMQFAGKPIELSPNRIFNCSYLAIDDYHAFSEIMFLLLGGSGVGYSVQKHHVEQLPVIHRPTKSRRFLVGDSIEGWADAVKALFRAYMCGKTMPEYDFRDIRPKGARLVTSGGKAPGPEPLKDCLHNIQKVLDRKAEGSKLSSLECHDIACYIADAVLAGGIRRAAMISLFSFDDDEMLTCKFNHWYELNPQRARANNSVVVLRHRIKEKEFKVLWKKIQASKTGEPGIFWTNNKDMGINPCSEISLRSNQMCNLTEINVSDVKDQTDLNERCRVATFLGTLQASYTDFHYLRDIWQKNCEKDALLGVSMTGICSGNVLKLNLEEAANVCVEENKRVAEGIGINPAARITCIKPSGTTSLVFGTSSGIHEWHDKYYIRRMRVGKNEALYGYLSEACPDVLEDDFFKPKVQAVISIPQKAPEGAITRADSSPIELLERVKRFAQEWISPCHNSGDNKHNVSVTVSLADEQYDEVGQWLWKNRDHYTGITVLPLDDHTYVQMPFESCTEEVYEKMLKKVKDIDLSQIIEADDHTSLTEQAACAGGACTITHV